ncbi:MAG: hypothetical protein HUJ60_00995 [Bacilli bacterium]|nr:hypothetical protein [Bacilli bacterium]
MWIIPTCLQCKAMRFLNKYLSQPLLTSIGQHVISEADLLKRIIEHKAWAAMVAYEKHVHGSLVLASKTAIVDFVEAEIISCRWYPNFGTWMAGILVDHQFDMRPGLWQKIFNITFKYMRCLQIATDNPMDPAGHYFAGYDFSDCDCPIDSLIANNVLDYGYLGTHTALCEQIAHRRVGTVWNRMSAAEYCNMQEAIDTVRDPTFAPAGILQAGPIVPSRLDVDILLF